jgi:hypothetical protein
MRSCSIIIAVRFNRSLVGTSCTWATGDTDTGTGTRGRGPTASALYVSVRTVAPIDGPHAVVT